MLGDGQFGVCLVDSSNQIQGWNAPQLVGTIAKITKCEDVEIDGMQLNIQTLGRSKFKIKKLFPHQYNYLKTMILIPLKVIK
jgi:Lon protease-like protein